MTYTNEIEVEVDFSDVDPNLLDQSQESEPSVSVLSSSSKDESDNDTLSSDDSDLNQPNLKLGDDEPKPSIAGRAARFFRKKS